MPRLTVTAFILVLLFHFSACEKEAKLTSGNLQIKMTTQKAKDSISYTHFIYDNQNRLSVILDSNNNGHKRRRELQYDATGRLTKAAEVVDGGSGVSCSFTHDNNGRIIQKLGTGNSIKNTYTYDDKGRLIADTAYSNWPGSIYEYFTYKYDNSNNIVEKKNYRKAAGAFQIEQMVQMQYDTKQNPYFPLAYSLYFVTNENNAEYCLSGNNCTSKSYPSGTILSYTYQYSSNNLPVSFAERDNTDPMVIYRNFFY
jgi:hypothetical protein